MALEMEEEEEISRELKSWRYVWFTVMNRSVNLMILGSCCRSTEDGGKEGRRRILTYQGIRMDGMDGNSEIMCLLSPSSLLFGNCFKCEPLVNSLNYSNGG